MQLLLGIPVTLVLPWAGLLGALLIRWFFFCFLRACATLHAGCLASVLFDCKSLPPLNVDSHAVLRGQVFPQGWYELSSLPLAVGSIAFLWRPCAPAGISSRDARGHRPSMPATRLLPPAVSFCFAGLCLPGFSSYLVECSCRYKLWNLALHGRDPLLPSSIRLGWALPPTWFLTWAVFYYFSVFIFRGGLALGIARAVVFALP